MNPYTGYRLAVVIDLALLFILALAGYSLAGTPAASAPAASAPASSSAEEETLFPVPNLNGDLWSRDVATGDWGGLRQDLADNGIQLDAGDLAGCLDFNGYDLATDQRGYPRTSDGDEDGDPICDMGAYELYPGGGSRPPAPASEPEVKAVSRV